MIPVDHLHLMNSALFEAAAWIASTRRIGRLTGTPYRLAGETVAAISARLISRGTIRPHSELLRAIETAAKAPNPGKRTLYALTFAELTKTPPEDPGTKPAP